MSSAWPQGRRSVPTPSAKSQSTYQEVALGRQYTALLHLYSGLPSENTQIYTDYHSLRTKHCQNSFKIKMIWEECSHWWNLHWYNHPSPLIQLEWCRLCHKINCYEHPANNENISESNTNTSCALTWRNVPIAIFGDVLWQSGAWHGHPRTFPVQLL